MELAHAYGVDGNLDVAALERVFASWLADPKDRSANVAVNALGAAFGRYLTWCFGMRWTRVDEYGEAFAVTGSRPRGGEHIVFPFDAVQKPVKSGETGFFRGIFAICRKELGDPKRT